MDNCTRKRIDFLDKRIDILNKKIDILDKKINDFKKIAPYIKTEFQKNGINYKAK